MDTSKNLEQLAINTIRFLSADAVQKANSGHPGLPMGAAAMAYALWTRHLRHNPKDAAWANRDRFILSGGHGSMLLYSLLHLTGYPLTLEEIKNFRQWESKTPGHPEYWITPGVEISTGPLGQGFANAVGIAIGQQHLAARFNRPGHELFDYFTYAIVTDGDLMEGITAEAASLAGHLKLGKLIFLYDDNNISIDGSTHLTFTEDVALRFESYGWHVLRVADGNDVSAVDAALTAAKEDARPSIICVKTIIGFGMPNRQGTAKAHGEPPGNDELDAAKRALGWPQEPRFLIPGEALEHLRGAVEQGAQHKANWQTKLDAYEAAHPEEYKDLARILAGELPAGWDTALPEFPADAKGMATRVSSGKVINAIAAVLPDLLGGSADLHPSTKTFIDSATDYQPSTPQGRSIHYGIREHAMGAVVNGLSTTPGIIPFGATFLVFSDYMRAPIRLSALSPHGSIWVFTHDSIGVGEDGPTHQPIEHLAALRAIPNMRVIRPADANEVREAWIAAVRDRKNPTTLIFSRQDLPTLDRSRGGEFAAAKGLHKGAYVLADWGKKKKPDIILMASGSEVPLIVEAGRKLAKDGVTVRVVSFPSWELFAAQSKSYRDKVLPPEVTTRLSVEAGVAQGWQQWASAQVSLERFGASAPGDEAMRKLGFSVANVLKHSRVLLKKR
ncbi:MAG TPA: transketolase [Anaerolineales bacterium]|nr:transketolase [Anaerolineales bacterium]HRQ92942.1 transketolase [Anaerolineales bacterium]